MGEDKNNEGNKENNIYLFDFYSISLYLFAIPLVQISYGRDNREVRVRMYGRG